MKITTELFTGLRPTGDLTIANYLGAIKPLVDMQSDFSQISMFVADLHALTDQEPSTVAANRYSIAADYLALGLDKSIANIFVQSAISEPLLRGTYYLSKLISMSELMRTPSLKDKLKDPEHPEKANVMLANYPILMAADILMQGSITVPVGDDQASHLEVARLLARRFNKKFGEVFVEPKGQTLKALRIMSLTGSGKMSKSKPNGAILLSEAPESAAKKIKRAETAEEGKMNPVLESHFTIAHAFANDSQTVQLAGIRKRHMDGEKVMGEFKQLLAVLVAEFLADYQAKRAVVDADPAGLTKYIERGNQLAFSNAQAVLTEMERAMKIQSS